MPLEDATRRLAFLLQRDLRRMAERERARAERGEVIHYDPLSRIATWVTPQGDVIGRWYGEIVARYLPQDKILRWAWAGRASVTSSFGSVATPTHAEVIAREGQARSVPELARSLIGDLDEEEASALARLGVIVARGEGMHVQRDESEVEFVGLFDTRGPREGETSDPARFSVPAPSVGLRAPSAPPVREEAPPSVRAREREGPGSSPPARRSPAPYRSLPPIREIYSPRNVPAQRAGGAPKTSDETSDERSEAPGASESSEQRVREPARALVMPVAAAVLSAVAKATPGYQQAVFVLTVHSSLEKRRVVLTIAVVDGAGVLRIVDPSKELLETAVRMVDADANDGNGSWRKLSARIVPKADGGASVKVDVV